MKRYRDMSGESGVVAFELAKDAITIRFVDGGTYVYDYTNPGIHEVEMMKRLALQGEGLATFINKYVRNAYAKKVNAFINAH